MKALTVIQPWAWLIANGKKLIETRTWSTDYRGPILIHAGRRYGSEEEQVSGMFRSSSFQGPRFPIPYCVELGSVVAVAELVGCRLLTQTEEDLKSAAGFIGEQGPVPEYIARFFRRDPGMPRLYAWVLKDVRKLEHPVECRGMQKLWTPTDEVLAKVQTQLQ